jgi:aryl-alcohol dehydrogenase-like predicted oxidoreductase
MQLPARADCCSWSSRQSGRSQVLASCEHLAIPGTTSVELLNENLAAASFLLARDEVAAITALLPDEN